jgi:hypothetical protein
MAAKGQSEPAVAKSRTTVERRSERELVLMRTLNGPARIVFEAWTKPDLLKRWWAPKSFGITFISCEADVRYQGCDQALRGHSPAYPHESHRYQIWVDQAQTKVNRPRATSGLHIPAKADS